MSNFKRQGFALLVAYIVQICMNNIFSDWKYIIALFIAPFHLLLSYMQVQSRKQKFLEKYNINTVHKSKRLIIDIFNLAPTGIALIDFKDLHYCNQSLQKILQLEDQPTQQELHSAIMSIKIDKSYAPRIEGFS